jgi:sec-independent protein translocase protein TatB
MFGLSTTEILIILALALIFVGPGELPKVARTIGKGVAQVRGAMGKVDHEMRRAMREAAAELEDEQSGAGKPTPDTAPPSLAHGADANESTQAPIIESGETAPAHLARDWSAIGKSPVPGRVVASTGSAAPEAGRDETSGAPDAQGAPSPSTGALSRARETAT